MLHTAAWFHGLTESVAALGSAVREYRAANEAAQLASWHIDPARIYTADGSVSVIGRDYIRPHDDALWKLGALYDSVRTSVKDLYQNAALAYAYGTATVLTSVLDGGYPTCVELGRRDSTYVLPTGPLPDLSGELGDWSGDRRLAELRASVGEREKAFAVVQDYGFYEGVADHPDRVLTNATKLADGLADVAHAYGMQAESALHHVLLSVPTGQPAAEEER